MRLGIRSRLFSLALSRALSLALCLGVPLAHALSSAEPPDIRIFARNQLGAHQYQATPGRLLQFGAQVERVDGIYTTPGSFPTDIYFGVIVPGGRTFTWVPNAGGGAVMVEGLVPLARAVSNPSFSTFDVIGAHEHTFGERDAPGLYSVFLILAAPGSDASDARSWHDARMVPLVFKGMTAPP